MWLYVTNGSWNTRLTEKEKKMYINLSSALLHFFVYLWNEPQRKILRELKYPRVSLISDDSKSCCLYVSFHFMSKVSLQK